MMNQIGPSSRRIETNKNMKRPSSTQILSSINSWHFATGPFDWRGYSGKSCNTWSQPNPFHGPDLVGPRSCQQPEVVETGQFLMEYTKCFHEIRCTEHPRKGCSISINTYPISWPLILASSMPHTTPLHCFPTNRAILSAWNFSSLMKAANSLIFCFTTSWPSGRSNFNRWTLVMVVVGTLIWLTSVDLDVANQGLKEMYWKNKHWNRNPAAYGYNILREVLMCR